MEAYITYVVSNNGNREVKDGMKKLGYLDYWNAAGTTYYLPNTTLWKKDTELSKALDDIKAVIIKANESRPANDKIRLERCMWFLQIPGMVLPANRTRN